MNRFISFVAMLCLIASCTSEIDQVNSHSRGKPSDEKTVFLASTENTSIPETKVYADENLKVLWNADDRISIFDFTTYNSQFAFTGDDGDTAGGFEQVGEDGEGADIDYVYAAYPYHAATQMDESGILTMMLPAEQQYKEDSFGIGANTMVAVTDGNFLAFKNVGGYLSLRLYGDDVKVSRITIKGNNGEKIAGKASITMPFGDVPLITMDEAATEEISIVCDPAVKIGSSADAYTDFWFVIPPVTFEKGFTITVTDDKGGVFEKSTSKSFTVSRNTLDWMNALKVVPNYDNVIIQFEDSNFKAYCVENFDTNGDGEISGAEASFVKSIGCPLRDIQSLSGIEFFTNLTRLVCYSNQLTSLDLSHNTALTYLSCYSNQLTSLDLSHNTALTYLSCYSNQLTSLDVSHCTALTDLQCFTNQLTNLVVSNNTSLTNLQCSSIQLKSLDVSNNQALTSLDCSCNQLTNLDVSGNTALISFNCSYNRITSLDVSNNTALKSLDCSFNQLDSLDINNNTALIVLYCVGNSITHLNVNNNTALTVLRCDSNQLTSLDVSHNTALTSLYCYSNQLTSLDISNNTALQWLHCYSNQLTSLDLSNNTALLFLRCESNQLTNMDVSKNIALIELWCSSNQLTSLDLSSNTTLSGLDCRQNMPDITIYLRVDQVFSFFYHDDSAIITEKGIPVPAGNITFEDPSFKAYCVENFDNNGDSEISYEEALIVTTISCGGEGIKSLNGIGFFINLQTLYCDFNQLTSLDLSSNTALSWLQCQSNQLTDLDISNNKALRYLYCGNNQLTNLDVSHNTALTKLACGNNQLTCLDVSHNTALTYLAFGGNLLIDLDLRNNKALTDLSCENNQLARLDVSNITALSNLVCGSNQLTSLDVSNNTALEELSCSSLQLTILDVSNNTALKKLDCSSNKLTSLVLSHNIALTDLRCYSNQLTSLDVSNNTALQWLYCHSNPSLAEICLKTGQVITHFKYDSSVATIKYKD